MANQEPHKGDIFIIEFNHLYKSYINNKKLTKKEKESQISRIQERIDSWRKEIKKQSTIKQKITRSVNSGKLNYINDPKEFEAKTKLYHLANQMIHIYQTNIKEAKETILYIQGKKDARISIAGFFTRFLIKRSYLLSIKDPASYILRRDLKAIDEYDNSIFGDVEDDKKRIGREKIKGCILENLDIIESGRRHYHKGEYPIKVIILSYRIYLHL